MRSRRRLQGSLLILLPAKPFSLTRMHFQPDYLHRSPERICRLDVGLFRGDGPVSTGSPELGAADVAFQLFPIPWSLSIPRPTKSRCWILPLAASRHRHHWSNRACYRLRGELRFHHANECVHSGAIAVDSVNNLALTVNSAAALSPASNLARLRPFTSNVLPHRALTTQRKSLRRQISPPQLKSRWA